MMTPVSIAKQPIRPMLVSFPIGLWIVSIYTMAGGIIGAFIAAVPGLIDYIAPRPAHKADRYLAYVAESNSRRSICAKSVDASQRCARWAASRFGSPPFRWPLPPASF